jgi:FlaA1/EpsC-like NDP-sugar epimerase
MPEAKEPDRRRTLPGRIVARVRRDIPLVLMDATVVVAAYLVALVLRFEGRVPAEYWRNFWILIPAAVLGYLYINLAFGLYGQMWRYASMREARRLLAAALVVGLWLLAASELLGATRRLLPLSVVSLGAAFTLLGLGAIRFQSRLFAIRRRVAGEEPTRVLIYGAGDAGAMVLRDILRHPDLGLRPVGLIDDDARKVGRSLQGVRVLGAGGDISLLAEAYGVDQVLLAIPSATSDVVRSIAALCEEANVAVRVLPSIREIVGHRVTARDIRDLKIEDLLGRQLVETDLGAVGSIVAGRRVLVTGAGGSIGSEICRQVLELGPEKLVMMDRDETHLHDVVTGIVDPDRAIVALADIRDREHVRGLFVRERPEVVFHAAAHKHLPILQQHPREAVLTNVLGTATVAQAALDAGVQRFVLISTDKAVRPTSVMGMSKWLAEQTIWSFQGRGCAFTAVRFGNVLGSRGGVVQTFLRQVADGGPVTVTDPRMARYFMSIQEAVQLVLQAAALSVGGEVFTLEMGQPVRIVDLAHEVIRLAGLLPGRDIKLVTVGARPGEKLVEDVMDPEERPAPSQHPSILASRPAPPRGDALRAILEDLELLAREGRESELAGRMRQAIDGLRFQATAAEGVPVMGSEDAR